MNLFPAVDIKNGQCVRLAQGIEDQATVFSDDPVAMARQWADMGAKWLHVIDLDGAFSGAPRNMELIRRLCAAVNIPVQLGGGIRSLDVAGKYLEAGIKRLIIGTVALEDPALFQELCSTYPGQIGVSLDARDGQLKTKGWVADSGKTVAEVVPDLEAAGAAFFIYTDISRDGMQTGVNIPALQTLLDLTARPVLIAGGISTLADIQAVFPLRTHGLAGIITGRAIYAGSLDLRAALDWLAAQN
ncbi:MAG: 1-(5-phosphoribosyl)-5-[(5-phosphoribosylamino)methylideneamino]imidazole-4-carboxamide isomerase [Desulfovibrionales bacterium]|nr:1-(5-phosphoribosyl)-5-[(5-phosphoribosylamino)methylideneamino]imidazole-4-carboxamide isomerase [Desulfovibrionales bacterium]